MIYLYGLAEPQDDGHPEEAFQAVGGVTGHVLAAPCGNLVLIHGVHDGGDLLPRRKLLLAHARVLEAAMASATILPMRFGMTCASVEAFGALVQASRHDIAMALDRLRGHVEVGVRVSAPEEAALTAALDAEPKLISARDRLTGRGASAHFETVDFGRALGDAVAARRRIAQKRLLAALVPLAAEHVLKAPDSDFEPLRAEFLVARDRLEAFSDRLDRAVEELDFAGSTTCAARLVGPGPAFNFVGLSLASPGAEEAA